MITVRINIVLSLTSALPLYDMAVFMINICKFNGCGITFPRLADLIEHIEDVHIGKYYIFISIASNCSYFKYM